jgi:hypothetical protein
MDMPNKLSVEEQVAAHEAQLKAQATGAPAPAVHPPALEDIAEAVSWLFRKFTGHVHTDTSDAPFFDPETGLIKGK